MRIMPLLVAFVLLAGCSSSGGMDYSVYGVQVIASDTDAVPAGSELELGFEAYQSARYIFSATSANKGNLRVRLVTQEQFEQGNRTGSLQHMYSITGGSVGFEQPLSAHKYFLLIRNQGGSAENVSCNITASDRLRRGRCGNSERPAIQPRFLLVALPSSPRSDNIEFPNATQA